MADLHESSEDYLRESGNQAFDFLNKAGDLFDGKGLKREAVIFRNLASIIRSEMLVFGHGDPAAPNTISDN